MGDVPAIIRSTLLEASEGVRSYDQRGQAATFANRVHGYLHEEWRAFQKAEREYDDDSSFRPEEEEEAGAGESELLRRGMQIAHEQWATAEKQEETTAPSPTVAQSLGLPFSAQEECFYHCSMDNLNRRRSMGEPIVQYRGKWGFRRLFGLQEFFSVLFSVLNAMLHPYHCCRSTRLAVAQLLFRRSRAYHHVLVALYAFFSTLSWLASAVFHARDVELTMLADYLVVQWLGGVALTAGLMYHVVDHWELQEPKDSGYQDPFWRQLLVRGGGVFAVILAHQWALVFGRADFQLDTGTHMLFCIGLAMAGSLVYFGILFRRTGWRSGGRGEEANRDASSSCEVRCSGSASASASAEEEVESPTRWTEGVERVCKGAEAEAVRRGEDEVSTTDEEKNSEDQISSLQAANAATAEKKKLAQLQRSLSGTPEFYLAIFGAYPLFLLFEWADFPPFFDLVDAHAVWHCASVPIQFTWYAWFAKVDREVFRAETAD
eukprot:g12354.t1